MLWRPRELGVLPLTPSYRVTAPIPDYIARMNIMLYELKLVCFAVASALILSLPATASDLEKQIPVKFETLAMRQTDRAPGSGV